MPDRVATDLIADDLVTTYAGAARRLELIVTAGLRRGLDPSRVGGIGQERGDATLAYRERQLAAATAALAELRRGAAPMAAAAASRAYGAGVLAMDRTALAGVAELRPRFGGIHARAVEVLAGNMTRSLEAATDRVGDNVARVFERASALEAGLPVSGGPAGRAGAFVGRRTDDPWRRVTLDTAAQGIVSLDTRRQVSASLVRRLVTEGVSDALTGFVDRTGRRWSLDRYAAMATRTTTREATSRAAVNRMTEHGLDLITISSHAHKADECDAYDGETFSLDGSTPGYDVIDQLPPFHPNCVHVVTPAAASFDDYLGELERAAEELRTASPARSPASSSSAAGRAEAAGPPAGEAPPFSSSATPLRARSSDARLEAQQRRELIDRDPGPEPGAELARDAEHDRIDKLNRRGENKYLRENLGDDLATFVGRKWAREARVRERYLVGELTTDDVEELAYEQYRRDQDRTDLRKRDEQEAGFRRGSIPCFVCGRRKPKPSAVCDFCGDDPVTHGGSAAEFDRSYGYSGELGDDRI